MTSLKKAQTPSITCTLLDTSLLSSLIFTKHLSIIDQTGATHSKGKYLWKKGQPVSDEFMVYAQDGQTGPLHAHLIQSFENEVLDAFEGPKTTSGDGISSVNFVADNKHHLVCISKVMLCTRIMNRADQPLFLQLSFAIRMVPSPDWFVGLDGLDLCANSTHWKDRLTLDLFPLDAGTDNGFTFTSPNYPTEPRLIVTEITTRSPSHPACSFYYPNLKSMPRVGAVHLE